MANQSLVGASPLPRKTNQKKKKRKKANQSLVGASPLPRKKRKEKWQTRVLLVPPPFPPDTHSTDPHPPICIQSKTTSILIHVLTRAYPSALLLFFHLPISSSSRAIFISVYHRASHSAASKNLFIMLRYYFSQTPTMSKEKRKCRRTFLTYFILFIFS